MRNQGWNKLVKSSEIPLHLSEVSKGLGMGVEHGEQIYLYKKIQRVSNMRYENGT